MSFSRVRKLLIRKLILLVARPYVRFAQTQLLNSQCNYKKTNAIIKLRNYTVYVTVQSTFSVPRKSMCSQKWASPGTLSGSHKYPVGGEDVCVCVCMQCEVNSLVYIKMAG